MPICPNTNDFAKKLCEALGLPKQTRSFDLHVEVDQVVSVTAEIICDVDFDKFNKVFAEYRLFKNVTTLDSNAVELK